jgi:uncharacterized damage-inducible protein DinB
MGLEFSTATEREALCGFLDQQRDALMRKVRGVSDADARTAPTASSLSLLGLLKHSALWERRWFQVIVAGRRFPGEWPEGTEDDFAVGDEDTVEHWLLRYSDEAAVSRQITADMGLDDRCARHDWVDENLRWVLLHLIEETARHAGHADIIRETLDGSRGM